MRCQSKSNLLLIFNETLPQLFLGVTPTIELLKCIFGRPIIDDDNLEEEDADTDDLEMEEWSQCPSAPIFNDVRLHNKTERFHSTNSFIYILDFEIFQ